MIPKYLKIKGLYSYQKEQEIDFGPLTDASLFGIFGAVGTGKSSVLEAITFALYGDTERLNRSGDDRTYNMMNLRSDELAIDFECIAGRQGNRYRFTVRGKRNSKNFKEVKTFERRGFIWQDETWVPLAEHENAEQIIGLSYDNFRRTIIIPQGRFQEFIELKDAERTRMMKELFQLEKYDLSQNVGSLSKKNDLGISNIDGQILGLGRVTPEMIVEEEGKRDSIREKIKISQEELLILTEQENQFQKLKQVFEKVHLLKAQLVQLQSVEVQMKLREEKLKRFEICSIHFKSFLDQKKSLTDSVARDQLSYQTNTSRLAGLSEILTKQKEIQSDLKPKYEKREELLDTAEELGKVIKILENTALAEKNKAALLRGENLLLEKTEAIETLKNKKNAETEVVESQKSNLSDVTELGLVKSWFATQDEIAGYRKSIKAEAEQLQTELASNKLQFLKRTEEANKIFPIKVDTDSGAEHIAREVKNFLAVIDQDQENLARQTLLINTRLALHAYASNLEDGQPCPLCGAEHHPSVLHADQTLTEEIQKQEKERLRLQSLEQLVRRFSSDAEKALGQIETLEKQKATIKARYKEAGDRLEMHNQLFVWTNFDRNNREKFEKHFSEVSQNLKDIREREAVIKKMSGYIELLSQEKADKIEKPLQILRNEILKIENTILTLSGQLTKVKISDFTNQESIIISEQMLKLKSSYDALTELYEKTSRDIDSQEKEHDMLSGSQATLLSALESNSMQLSLVQEKINEELKSFDFESENLVEEILREPLQIASEKKALDEYKSAMSNVKRDLETLQLENPEQLYDPGKHEAVLKSRNALTDVLNMLRKEEGKLEGLLKKLADDLAKKALLLLEKSRLLLRKEHLDDLAKLFRSSGFVDYASSIYLQNLIQAANHRFHQMTHQRLHLELGEGNSFWVRDLLNGGHMRLLKTLSGGQKFQAALSLALALADHIHVRNQSVHNFFFLDEGFGSLDKNALQTVFETLKSLRKENRIVGIISHVEDLQQEIQTYLRIEESEEGSKILKSWEN